MTALLPVLRRVAGILFGFAIVVTSASAQNRGELLYSTHCRACHTAQMHWRATRTVTDWTSLRAEVRKWQAAALLSWSEDDVLDVARYLNDSIYHFVDTRATAARTSPTNQHPPPPAIGVVFASSRASARVTDGKLPKPIRVGDLPHSREAPRFVPRSPCLGARARRLRHAPVSRLDQPANFQRRQFSGFARHSEPSSATTYPPKCPDF